MSKSVTGPGKPDALREQLDELDQLMERMLALGVQQPPEESQNQVEPDIVSDSSNSNTTSLELPPLEAPTSQAPEPGRATLPEESRWSEPQPESRKSEHGLAIVDLAPPGPTFVALDTETGISSTPFFADFQFAPPPGEIALNSLEAPTTSTADLSIEPAPALAAGVTVIVAWWLRPLALVNSLYNGSTGWLGPIGRGLQSRLVRNFLGLCGLGAMLGAAAWMLWEGVDWHT